MSKKTIIIPLEKQEISFLKNKQTNKTGYCNNYQRKIKNGRSPASGHERVTV